MSITDIENPRIRDLARTLAIANAIYGEHTTTSLRRSFAAIDDTASLLSGALSPDEYMHLTLGVDQSRPSSDPDPDIEGELCSLLAFLLTYADRYDCDLHALDRSMEEHRGWEFLACSGRYLCCEHPTVAARMINDFVNCH